MQRILVLLAIVVLLANMVFFALGIYGDIIFWAVIGAGFILLQLLKRYGFRHGKNKIFK